MITITLSDDAFAVMCDLAEGATIGGYVYKDNDIRAEVKETFSQYTRAERIMDAARERLMGSLTNKTSLSLVAKRVNEYARALDTFLHTSED